MTSFSTAAVARCCRRVASERMKIASAERLFMRMRSPSKAPPLLRRVGSMATTAICRSGQPREELIGEAGFAGPAAAGDADDGDAGARAGNGPADLLRIAAARRRIL